MLAWLRGGSTIAGGIAKQRFKTAGCNDSLGHGMSSYCVLFAARIVWNLSADDARFALECS